MHPGRGPDDAERPPAPTPRLSARAGRASLRAAAWVGRRARGEVVELVGGPARARVILLFGGVLALSGADAATVGAVAPSLERSLHIGNAKIGLLSSVALLVGAVFTIPAGLLVDRFNRMPMLSLSIILWSLSSLAGALAGSYSDLLLSRLALGAVTATAGPAIASLTGDYFPARERGRVYAYILGGETLGTAIGFIVSGAAGNVISWRAAFVLLAFPGFFLARTLWRTVPEPLRGGQSRLEPGATTLEVADDPAPAQSIPEAAPGTTAGEPPVGPAPVGPAPVDPAPVDPTPVNSAPVDPAPEEEADDLARAEAQRQGVEPNERLILREDPQRMGIARAVRYTLSVPSNLMLTIGSSLGYFYFAGLQTFALLFVRGHYHVDLATSELGLGLLVAGALVGTLVSGHLTDALLREGFLEARMLVPAVCYLGATALFIPGILGTHLTPSLWFDVGGAALVSAANPPLQAARLDIMPAGLWGRAESVRTLARSLTQALAPLMFGGVADLVAGILPRQTPIGTHPGQVTSGTATGLEVSFLIMLAALAAAGLVLIKARKTYATDVVTAAAARPG